jgi:hypothetical protein
MPAALANLPQATFASKVVVADGKATVSREVDGDAETLSLKLPAVRTIILASSQRWLFYPIHKLNGLIVTHEFFETADDVGFHRVKTFFAMKVGSEGLIEPVVQVGTDFLNLFGAPRVREEN